MMLRVIFRKELETYADLSNSVWVYSMWKGYLERSESMRRLQQWTEEKGIPFVFLHTSGHARLSDLKRLAEILSPQVLIPIHTYQREQFPEYFENVHCLDDGERFEV